MSLFTIPDSGKFTVPFIQLHYYKWLKKMKLADINACKTKSDYLRSLGFIQGKFHISADDLRLLQWTEEHFFLHEIKPELV